MFSMLLMVTPIKDSGKWDVIGRRFFDGISIPQSTAYSGRWIGPDGTDNWVRDKISLMIFLFILRV